MKKIIKILMAVSLAIVLLCVDYIGAGAKDYYDKKFNPQNTKTPYTKVNKKIAEIYVSFDENNRTSSIKDFDGDGKKEKIVLSTSGLSEKNHKVKIKITINGKAVINRKVSGDFEYVYFRTMKLQGRTLGVLECEDGYGGVAESKSLIYLWKDNAQFKLMKAYKEKGHLDVFVARDKALKKDVLYISDYWQIYNRDGEKWPPNVLERYKKYADNENVSVTRTIYYKYECKNGKLKRVGKDNYYKVTYAYE